MTTAQIISHFGREYCTITQFRFAYRAQINTIGLKNGNIQNSHRAGQDGVSVTIKCRGVQDQHNKLAFIRKHQQDATTMGNFDPTIRLLFPARNIDFSGFVKNVSMTTDRFDIAPTISFNMELARDNINSLGEGTTGIPSWDAVIYGGNHSDIQNPDDWVLPDLWSPVPGHPALGTGSPR